MIMAREGYQALKQRIIREVATSLARNQVWMSINVHKLALRWQQRQLKNEWFTTAAIGKRMATVFVNANLGQVKTSTAIKVEEVINVATIQRIDRSFLSTGIDTQLKHIT